MFKRFFAMMVIFCMLFTGVIQGAAAVENPTVQGYSDISGHWAADSISEWTELGLFSGYPDGTFRPDNNLTRAEFCAVVNKIFGYGRTGGEKFKDVKDGSWYSSVAAKATAAGYIDSWANTFKPDVPITRAEVAAAVFKAFKLEYGESLDYSDKYADMADYGGAGIKEIDAVIRNGIMGGYEDRTFRPDKNITRAEFLKVLSNSISKLYNAKGEYTGSGLKGNVIINTAGVTVKDAAIDGNLYLTEGIGEGDATLENVTVTGKTYINGGGKNSIHITGCTLTETVVDKAEGDVRIVSTDSSATITVRSGVIYEVKGTSAKSSIVIDSDTPAGTVIEISGNVDSVICNSPGVIIRVAAGSAVKNLTIAEDAGGTVLEVKGRVESAIINAADIKINDRSVAKGARGIIDGVTGALPYVNSGSGSPSGGSNPPPAQVQKAATPVLSPAAGTYSSVQKVAITSATEGATIRYTTDGTAPNGSSAVYTGPVDIAVSTTVSAIAVKSGMTDSDVASAAYVIDISLQQVAVPEFTPAAGTYSSVQTVTITSATAGATIRYTTDGTAPNGSSAEYTAPITVYENKTIRAIAVKEGMADSEVASAEYVIDIPPEELWTMVWNDEFDGTALDTDKWRTENKGDGFGNNEEQYYKPDNAVVQDGKLVIQAKKENYGGRSYTSAKLFSKADWKYGKFEASIKLPVGQGFWPAFWMMPTDGVYGGWAASGEVDIMEAKGRLPKTTSGTLHYGGAYPSNKYTGADQVFPDGQTINEFHTYSIEWEPGEFRWYVDGRLFQTQKSWNTNGANGEEPYSFPAPFDQKFYLMLNLAIGGNFDGGIKPSDDMFPTRMEVDYVRVYNLTGRPYKTPEAPSVPKEPLPDGARQPDATGNLVNDVNFENGINNNPEGSDELFGDGWNYVHNAQFGGAANVTVEDVGGTKFAKVNVTNRGSQAYSVQLEQLTTVGKGRWYKYSFDAKADKNRTLSTKLGGGPTGGWAAYSDSYSASLTTQLKHFEYVFQMAAASDILTRIEFNCATDTGSVWIGNVRVEEIAEPSIDYGASKNPLPVSENRIYNGAFDKYTIDRLAYWNVVKTNAAATISVPENTRELTADITNGGADAGAIVVNQKGIQLEAGGKYMLRFKARSEAGRTIGLRVAGKDGIQDYVPVQELALTAVPEIFEVPFTMIETGDPEAQLIFLLGGSDANVYIDDVSLIQTDKDYTDIDLFPLKNGEFTLGLTSWEPFTQGAAATFSVVNGEAKVSVTRVGVDNWGVMLNQGNMDLAKGVEYELSFDARASVPRDIEVTVENANYARAFQTGSLDLTTEMQHFSYTFKPAVSETQALKFILGNTSKYAAGDIYIDNVVLQVKDAPVKRPVTLAPDTTDNKVGQPAEITFSDDPAWRAAVSAVKLNGTALSGGKYTLEAGKLTLNADNFTSDQNYTIAVEAEGYATTSIVQQMLSSDGNLIVNGKFDTNGGWEFWNNAADWSSYKIENGVAAVKINYHGARDDEWGVPFSWSTQFKQSNVKLKAGKTYELSFRAWCEQFGRPIEVEFTGYNNNQKTAFNISGDQTAVYRKSITTGGDVTLAVNFLLGYVENGGFVTPDGEHTVYIDDVAVKEVTTPPVLTSDKTDNRVGQDIEITFADNTAWRSAITAVKLNGTALQAGYTIAAGRITLDKSLFAAAGSYSISVEATNYGIADVTQVIVASDGNLIKNGSMSSDEVWTFWNNWTNSPDYSSVAIADGVAKINVIDNGGTGNEWGVPFSWSTQFNQGGIVLEAGKTYELSFRAWSTAIRPIQVELTGYNADQKINFNITGDQSAVYKTSLSPAQALTISVKYLLGNVVNGSATTPNSTHDIFIDDVALREVAAAPRLTADASDNKLGQNIDITFTNNSANTAWMNAITAVKVDGITLPQTVYTISAGKITISSGAFTEVKEYSITVEATGYGIAQVTQRIKTQEPNIALGKACGASDNPKQIAALAFDGNMGTRWESASLDPQWIWVNLGGIYNLNSITIYWENARSSDYRIQVATVENPAESDWTDIYTATGKTGSMDEIALAGQEARYVRLYATKRALPYGHSIFEFEIYGTPKIEPASAEDAAEDLTGGEAQPPATEPDNTIAPAENTQQPFDGTEEYE